MKGQFDDADSPTASCRTNTQFQICPIIYNGNKVIVYSKSPIPILRINLLELVERRCGIRPQIRQTSENLPRRKRQPNLRPSQVNVYVPSFSRRRRKLRAVTMRTS